MQCMASSALALAGRLIRLRLMMWEMAVGLRPLASISS